LFNKAVRKLNSHLKQIVESDVEQNLMASKKDAKKAARATENMTQTSKSLQEDMHDGAAEVMQNMRDKEEEDASNKKKKKNQSNSSAVAALLSEDQDLMAYAIKGDDEEWEKATQGGKKALSSISLKNDNKRSLLADSGDGDGGESNVGRILNEAEEERAANEKKNKKKKPKILGGGFNETVDKKKNKKHAFKKPEGKYKNV
jgi:hypothetical protein